MSEQRPTDEVMLEVSFLRRNWQILSFVLGNMLFLLAVLLWKGPITQNNRDEFRRELEQAIRLFEDGDYIECNAKLVVMEPRLWRDPPSAGLVYSLRGRSALQLAQLSQPPRSAEFRAEAIAYLQVAQLHPIPAPWRLGAREAYGKVLLDAGRIEQSMNVLTEALHYRRMVQTQLFRLAVQSALEHEPRDLERLSTSIRSWSQVPTLTPSERDLCETSSRLLQAGAFDELRDLLAGAAPEQEQIADVDDMAWNELRVEFELAAADPEAAIEFIDDQRARNDAALSDDLLFLQQGALARSPADYPAALEFGRQRYGVDGTSRETLNDAYLRQAEILLTQKQPKEARRLLQLVDDPGPQRFNARYLMGVSYFREAQQWDQLTVEEWENSSPIVAPYRKFIRDVVAGVSSTDPRQTRVARWRRRLAETLSPAALKNLLADASYRRAIAMFEKLQEDQLQSDQHIVESDYARSMLMSAVAYTQCRDYDTADRIYENVRNFFPQTDFAEAAAFLRADSQRKAGLARAVAEFREACEATKTPWENDFLSIEDLREIFRNAWEYYDQSQQYESALVIAELYKPFSSSGDADEMYASSALRYAGLLESQAATVNVAERSDVAAQSRRRYRDASKHFLLAAGQKEEEPGYPDLVWQSALASYRGQDFVSAADLFDQFVRLHGPGERAFLANLLLANSLIAQKKWGQARSILEEVLREHPSSPDRFEGRIRLAQCYVELADGEQDPQAGKELVDAALILLRKNTDGLGIDLEPTAREWRESLFELGRILYIQQRFDEAIPRLQEAVRRFPDAERSWDARAQLAEAYFRSAEEPAQRLEQETTPQVRAALAQQQRMQLQNALQEYRTLASLLKDKLQPEQATPALGRLLMNATFRIADVLMALEDWPAAIDAYTTAANRYQDQPECLAAYIAIANAYGKLSRPDDAQSTLRQARWVLKQMDDELFVGSALTRQQWSDRLDSLVGNL